MSKLIEKDDVRQWIEDDVLDVHEADGWALIASVDGDPILYYELVGSEARPILTEYRNEIWTRIKAKREELQALSPTTYGEAQSDPKSRADICGLATAALTAKVANQPFSRKWTMNDGTEVMMTADQMIDFGLQVMGYIDAVHQHSRQLWATMETICETGTLEDLQAIDVDAGWPG